MELHGRGVCHRPQGREEPPLQGVRAVGLEGTSPEKRVRRSRQDPDRGLGGRGLGWGRVHMSPLGCCPP